MTDVTYRTYTGTAAELYESFFVPTIATPVSRELLATAELGPGERVLDLACGTGVVTRAAAEQVGATGAVTGVDVSPEMLEVAATIPAGGAPIEWRQADAAALPLPDASYDVALCQLGLMFMEDRQAAIAELHRVLVPGGRVVVSTPGRIQPLFEAMERAIAEQINPDLGAFVSAVFSMSDPLELATLLRSAGFETAESKEYSAPLALPPLTEFLWSYINLTPLGPLVAAAPEDAKAAMERHMVEAWRPHDVGAPVTVDQPMALAWGSR